jgi:putative spermidine/putrescine transport system ATP-binding protein
MPGPEDAMKHQFQGSADVEVDLEVRDLSKEYDGFRALDQVDLTVCKGELISLLGPSGCGKTTLLRSIAGLVDPSQGAIRIKGKEILGIAPHQRNVGFVFQSYALFPHMTVRENVGFGLKMRGDKRAHTGPAVDRSLETVKMQHLAHRYPGELSGGQQQRIAIARSIVLNPTLLLLDEPFAALDRALRDHMQMEVKALQRRLGITTLFVTHDQDEALRISDRIAVMNAGRIEQIDTPIGLYKNPRTPFVLNFIGKSNVFSGRVLQATEGGATIDLGGHVIEVPLPAGAGLVTGSKAMISVRPERIVAESAAPREGEMGIPALVRDAVFLGGSLELHLRSAISEQPIVISRQGGDPSGIQEGSEVWLSWQQGDVLTFPASASPGAEL